MKLFAICSIVTAALFSTTPSRAEDSDLFILPVKKAFIPQGFDSNDTVQVVLTGTLSGSCEKIAHTQILTSDDPTRIEVIQWGRRFNGICLPLTSTYNTELTLGRLDAGTYNLVASGMPAAQIEVTEASVSTQDDYIYAPVAKATVGREGTGYVATLSGTLPNDCYSWQELKLLDQGDVLVVLPILSWQDSGSCSQTPVPFSEKVTLPSGMAAEYHLLHVRSASGRALNKVFFSDGD
jgi:hypothetical protein